MDRDRGRVDEKRAGDERVASALPGCLDSALKASRLMTSHDLDMKDKYAG